MRGRGEMLINNFESNYKIACAVQVSGRCHGALEGGLTMWRYFWRTDTGRWGWSREWRVAERLCAGGYIHGKYELWKTGSEPGKIRYQRRSQRLAGATWYNVQWVPQKGFKWKDGQMIPVFLKEHSDSSEGWTTKGQIKMDMTDNSTCTQVTVDEMDGLQRCLGSRIYETLWWIGHE